MHPSTQQLFVRTTLIQVGISFFDSKPYRNTDSAYHLFVCLFVYVYARVFILLFDFTGMFTGVSPTAMWGLLRVLKPEYVVDQIVDAMRHKDPTLALPRAVYLAPFLKAILPASWCDWIMMVSKIANSMDGFTGRRAIQKE